MERVGVKQSPAQFELFSVAELERDERLASGRARIPAAWALLPDGPAHRDLPIGKCLYDSPARGLAARAVEAVLWRDAFDNFGSSGRMHGWDPDSGIRYADERDLSSWQLDRCEPSVMTCDLRGSEKDPVPPCGHTKDSGPAAGIPGHLYKCGCLGRGCDWEGPARGGENAAVEDGMDHAWPGWRDLPTVRPLPEGAKVFDVASTPRQSAAHKAFANWVAEVNGVYPEFWLENGGPIRTLRRPLESRHVPGRTPFGGYDLGVPKTGPRGFPLCKGRGKKGGSGDCGVEGIGPGTPWCIEHWSAERDPAGAESARKLGLL